MPAMARLNLYALAGDCRRLTYSNRAVHIQEGLELADRNIMSLIP